jgi:hypothetical protein
MGSEESRKPGVHLAAATADQFTGTAGPDESLAWEEVAAGRYMPRRIKGSCKGRALG